VAGQAGFEPDRSVKPRIVDKLFAERAINRKEESSKAA
jgi:hypothetical protein